MADTHTPNHSLEHPPRGPLKNLQDLRQLGIVALYLTLMFAMYFLPEARHPLIFVITCGLSFLNAVVIHNHLHSGIFKSQAANKLFRGVLSFGSLYPASANIPSHNLVHHRFNDDGAADWAAPDIVNFKWHLLNLLHFPNVNGTQTFVGIQRWLKVRRLPDGFKTQYILEQVFAFGLTGLLLYRDVWSGLFFVVMPQLWGARCILRINLIQHDACDTRTQFNHSRNFVGTFFNWLMCNNGYHTIHHNLPTLHWSVLRQAHREQIVPKINPRLDERSMVAYLLRTFAFRASRPAVFSHGEVLGTPTQARTYTPTTAEGPSHVAAL